MTKKKLTERRQRIEADMAKAYEKIDVLKKELKEVEAEIKEIEEREIITLINTLGLTYRQATEFLEDLAKRARRISYDKDRQADGRYG